MKNEVRASLYKQAFANDENLHTILDAIPLCCSFWDEHHNIFYCNNEVLSLFGLADRQEYLDNFFELSPIYQPDGSYSRDKYHEKLDEAFKNGHAVFEWRHTKKGGEMIYAEVSITRMDIKGRIVAVSCIRDMGQIENLLDKIREITDNEQNAIREADECAQVMWDAAPICCNLWDESGKNIDCNQEATDLFELSGKSEYLDRYYDLSPQFQPDGSLSIKKIKEKVSQAFEQGWVRYEWMHQKLNGDLIPAEVILVRVKRADCFVVVGYTRDLREIKESISLLNQLEILAFTDSLTGIHNRRYFIDMVKQEFLSSDGVDNSLSLIMFDLDRFKLINDTYGHMAGDEILKLVVKRVQSTLRSTDLFSRYGGEEFLVFIRGADRDLAVIMAWRIRNTIARSRFEYGGNLIPVTLSLGVASKEYPADTFEDVLQRADMALYEAKQGGRNTVRY